MKKKIISNLEKCYSIAPLTYNGKKHILVAAEKHDRCILFDLDGNEVDTIWDEPGGVMTMLQIPGSNGQFLATHQFYSPNDSKNAKIVLVTPEKEGQWNIKTLVELPFVHRFDILESDGVRYLIACTIKSGHNYKDDWSMPGKVYGVRLPDDINRFAKDQQLKLSVIKDDMLKNHGYYKVNTEKGIASLISSEQGVFLFYPPNKERTDWKIEQILTMPTSDATMIDLDGDGEMELITLSPFHGPDIRIFKKQNGTFKEFYKYPGSAEFTHAIWSGDLCGRPTVILGHRQGEKKLLAFTYNKEMGNYEYQVIDTGCGPANVLKYEKDDQEIVVATNREIDEVALYYFD